MVYIPEFKEMTSKWRVFATASVRDMRSELRGVCREYFVPMTWKVASMFYCGRSGSRLRVNYQTMEAVNTSEMSFIIRGVPEVLGRRWVDSCFTNTG